MQICPYKLKKIPGEVSHMNLGKPIKIKCLAIQVTLSIKVLTVQKIALLFVKNDFPLLS